MAAQIQHTKQVIKFNWPVVSGLLLITAIPGIPAIFIVALVLLGSGAVAGASDVINAQYFATPAAILTHASAGALFFLMMPWQFSPRMRVCRPTLHKVGGQLVVVSGCVMAISGVWMHLMLTPNELGGRFVSLLIMSVAICGAFCAAIAHVKKGRITQHKKWMIRAAALALAAITPLFTGALLQLVFSAWEGVYETLLAFHHNYDRLIAMVINLVIVEVIIRQKSISQPSTLALSE
ncbi:DUF2306 domain-containing protein [Pseudoalteromonas luteoviolacea]|uniref:DUF2306 domain-containing protein n=1 Tax=Pseudoalteromonas luteoviolacea NCIMB 1942 TaxID=1365253 RepID=A0A167BH93_9GAMM|nr:DUF2306 domain-containing protein [Pseudoalteromonas luteoviolacea]KZN46536.1 hypothetical protein N482_12150 [Pseudoalteromonas luteoviolacea NCIMB 1942]